MKKKTPAWAAVTSMVYVGLLFWSFNDWLGVMCSRLGRTILLAQLAAFYGGGPA